MSTKKKKTDDVTEVSSMTQHHSGSAAIECSRLTKDYRGGRGVFDLDLKVSRGEVFGFVGPNGAGKTTTIRLLMDLIRPDRGAARIFGLDACSDSLEVKRLVGYLPGELARFPGATGGYVIRLLAGLRRNVDMDRVSTLADRLDLDLGLRYEDLSHGNKQKVGLIQAFMHQPDLLILDEPTLGLDPLMQRRFRQLVEDSVADGATVFLSSHVLSEVEQICDRIGLIRGGRLIRVGTLEELREMRVHRVDAIYQGTVRSSDLGCIPGVTDVQLDDHHLACSIRGPVSPLLHVLIAAGVVEIDSRELSLEEIFLSEFEGTVPGADL
jgi:ABC-2 type transport system ATP-binding protein